MTVGAGEPGSSSGSVVETVVDDVTDRLRARGERITAPRRAVLGVLAERSGHLRAEEIIAAVAERDPLVHRASVYRSLEALSDLGMVQHVHVGHGATAYHLTDTSHLHAQCRSCGAVCDLPGDLLDAVTATVGERHDFHLEPGHVALSGAVHVVCGGPGSCCDLVTWRPFTQGSMNAGNAHRVDLEVFFFRVDEAEPAGVAYRIVRAPLRADLRPDDAASRLASAGHAVGSVSVLHSTSWRADDSGRLVLTYAAVPDPHPHHPTVPLRCPAVVSSGDPLHPTPPLLHAHHVAAHAVRHLADLARRDPGIAEATARPEAADLWGVILTVAESIPTGTHTDIHRAAVNDAASGRTGAATPSTELGDHRVSDASRLEPGSGQR